MQEVERVEEEPTWRDLTMMRLYREMKRARYAEVYFGARAGRYELYASCLQIGVTVATSAAVINLLTALAPPLANQILTALAAVASVVGPWLGLEEKRTNARRAQLGYCIARERLRDLIADLRMSELSAEHRAREREVSAFMTALAPFTEPSVNGIAEAAWEQVEQEYPGADAWTMI